MGKYLKRHSWVSWMGLLALLPGFFAWLPGSAPVAAQATEPGSVTIAGTLETELGCSGDWDPGCAAAHLVYDAGDDVWQTNPNWSLPAGTYEYKAALNDLWTENYGLHAVPGGANIPLALNDPTVVKFYYDHKTHWVTDGVNSVIVTAPGNFQSQLGCPGDWDPGCLRSWLEDPDGDGIYTFTTNGLRAGAYQVKAAINETWAVNYGQNGVQNGPNITFSVPFDGAQVAFRYDASTHLLTASAGHSPDGNVETYGLGHDSRDSLYRVPFGAITPNTTLLLRFRTYHHDVTRVRARFYDTATQSEFFQDLALAASGVSCYDPAQPAETCDFWQTSLTPAAPTTLYYRFIVMDGTTSAYYADDSMLDGGWGAASPELIDNSYAVTVYDPAFQPVPWMQDAVVYQIFPDRFRNGTPANDPNTSKARYGYPPNLDDQVVNKAWEDLPEGYCRSYLNPATTCTESPRGRDYFGGDLTGVQQKLDYLQSLGVTVLYFNPIFESASNHGYDTRDYRQIENAFGKNSQFTALVSAAHERGMKVILDGVFNHVSSDSPYFDRYHHFAERGACEDVNSPYRAWFSFHEVAAGQGTCAGAAGPNSATYDGWFGYDSLPVLDKTNSQVQSLVYAANDAVARIWLKAGADGWRLDVMNDGSFPSGFWQGFREAVKATDNEAVIVGELWKKGDVLPMIHGDQADTTMNYRFRNAILGFFGTVDQKGFPDDGAANESPSLFASKLLSIREDYPAATYLTAMNLLDSHDTQRILWSLTPGENNREEKEFNAANLAQGKQLLRLALTVQMTLPGAPTIYYGDEVGVTGADDPDDRRTFPWENHTFTKNSKTKTTEDGYYGALGDHALLDTYRTLTSLRRQQAVFRSGQVNFLFTDDAQRTLAYLLRSPTEAALVAINRDSAPQTLTIPLNGLLPSGVVLVDALQPGATRTAVDGQLTVELPAFSALILLPAAGQDLAAPAAPANLTAVAGNGQVDLTWEVVGDAAGYNLYRSPLTGGGYVRVAQVPGIDYTDHDVVNGRRDYYVVRAVDAAGNEGPVSNEAAATPYFPIEYAILQWPKTLTHVLSVHPTETIYGQVYVGGLTDAGGNPDGILAQVGFGPQGSDPAGWTTWVEMVFNAGHSGDNNFEYMGSLRPEVVGVFDILVRFSTDGGLHWEYGDQDGDVSGGGASLPGVLTVTPNPDTTPPEAPANLNVSDWSTDFIAVRWDPVVDAAEYWISRRTDGQAWGDPLAKISAAQSSYTDASVNPGVTYTYAIQAVDEALNLSPFSNEVSQKAEPRMVNVTFRVRVPAQTPAADTVYLSGNISPLGPWNPGIQAMENRGGGIWEITLPILDGTALEYKYTRGSWDRVEWWGSIVGTANRHVTISYGTTGAQWVEDTATDWGSGSDDPKGVQYWRDPLVAATDPADGAALTSPPAVTVAFSQAIQPPQGGDFSGAVSVTLAGSAVPGTVSPVGSNGLVWTPSTPLAAGVYTVTVFNVRSSLGGDSVLMQSPYTFSFTVIP